jgi:large subunit ribosomal protein L32
MRNAGQTPLVQKCPNCEEPKLPHRVCMKCGQYDGKQVLAAIVEDDE